MIYRICQVWGEGELHELEACQRPEQVTCFLESADADGRLRLWGEVLILNGITQYTPAQWLRSRRVYETIDALSPGRRRPGYGNEYARSLYELNPENWEPLLSYSDPAPNTLESDELPQDDVLPAGPNWHIRARIRYFGDDMSMEEALDQRARQASQRLGFSQEDVAKLGKALNRLSQPAPHETRPKKAIASAKAQTEPNKPLERPVPVPSVDDQLHELALEQVRDFPIRPVEQRTRRSLDRYMEDLPKGAYIDPTQ